ncbi:MAG: toxin-antitoxin system HicB family antitoxin [Pseudomonadota bacterium]
MSTAKLTAALLAPKGAAQPLPNIYDNPMQKPLTLGFDSIMFRQADGDRRKQPERRQSGHEDAKLTLRLARDNHRKLKILAARRGVSLQAVLRDALADHLNGQDHECTCMRTGNQLSAACQCRH